MIFIVMLVLEGDRSRLLGLGDRESNGKGVGVTDCSYYQASQESPNIPHLSIGLPERLSKRFCIVNPFDIWLFSIPYENTHSKHFKVVAEGLKSRKPADSIRCNTLIPKELDIFPHGAWLWRKSFPSCWIAEPVQ